MKRILAFLMIILMSLSLFSITSFAATSPEAEEYYTMTVGIKGKGYSEVNQIYATNEDVVIFTAKLGEEGYFVGWEIIGDFEPVDGDELSTAISIKPKSNITAIAVFSGGEEEEAVLSTPIDKDPISPQTGQDPNHIYTFLALLCAATLGIFFSIYKIKKN